MWKAQILVDTLWNAHYRAANGSGEDAGESEYGDGGDSGDAGGRNAVEDSGAGVDAGLSPDEQKEITMDTKGIDLGMVFAQSGGGRIAVVDSNGPAARDGVCALDIVQRVLVSMEPTFQNRKMGLSIINPDNLVVKSLTVMRPAAGRFDSIDSKESTEWKQWIAAVLACVHGKPVAEIQIIIKELRDTLETANQSLSLMSNRLLREQSKIEAHTQRTSEQDSAYLSEYVSEGERCTVAPKRTLLQICKPDIKEELINALSENLEEHREIKITNSESGKKSGFSKQLGFSLAKKNGTWLVAAVDCNGLAWKAGLCMLDQLTKVEKQLYRHRTAIDISSLSDPFYFTKRQSSLPREDRHLAGNINLNVGAGEPVILTIRRFPSITLKTTADDKSMYACNAWMEAVIACALGKEYETVLPLLEKLLAANIDPVTQLTSTQDAGYFNANHDFKDHIESDRTLIQICAKYKSLMNDVSKYIDETEQAWHKAIIACASDILPDLEDVESRLYVLLFHYKIHPGERVTNKQDANKLKDYHITSGSTLLEICTKRVASVRAKNVAQVVSTAELSAPNLKPQRLPPPLGPTSDPSWPEVGEPSTSDMMAKRAANYAKKASAVKNAVEVFIKGFNAYMQVLEGCSTNNNGMVKQGLRNMDVSDSIVEELQEMCDEVSTEIEIKIQDIIDELKAEADAERKRTEVQATAPTPIEKKTPWFSFLRLVRKRSSEVGNGYVPFDGVVQLV